MKGLFSYPLYTYLYGFSFLLFKTSAYFASFSFLSALCLFFVYCLATCLMNFFFKRVTNSPYAGIATCLIWISVLHAAGIAQLFGYPYSYIPAVFYIRLYSCVLLLITVYCICINRVPPARAAQLNTLANVFLVMTCLVFFMNGWKRFSDNRAEAKAHFHTTPVGIPPATHPDIIWILMDEYGSSASLKQQFGFVNPIDSFLQQKGFTLLPAMHSRFNNTLFSVNSLFNLDDSVPPSSYYEGVSLLKHGSLVPAMEKAGYRFVNLGFFDIAEHPMIADRSGYPYTYLQQVLSGTLFGALYANWKNTNQKSDQYNQQVLQNLKDSLSTNANQPRFIWAHMPVPHTPFCRNQKGEMQKDTSLAEKDSGYIKRKYIDYLQYGNALLQSLIKEHPELSQKIVIISGDHGPRFPFLQNKTFQTWPYAAVHIPGQYDTAGLARLSYISQIPGFLFHE